MAHNLDFFNDASLPSGVRELFDPEINVQEQDHKGNTILHRFVLRQQNFPGVLDSLIKRGTCLEIKNNYERTAFLQAVLQFNEDMINTFIAHHADVHTTDDDGHNALHYLTFSGKYVDLPSNLRWVYPLLEFLLKRRVDVNLRNRNGETPLMFAAQRNNLKIVKILLKHGADVRVENILSETCLHLASNPIEDNARVWAEPNSGIITELIRNGATVNSFDHLGRTPLSYILLSRHPNRFYFAEKLLIVACLVNWRHRIQFHILRNRTLGWLRGERALSALVEKCYVEIAVMRRFRLSEAGYNLCQFALKGVSTIERTTARQESNAVFRILLRQNFNLYHRFILYSFDVKFLRWKFTELYFSATLEEGDIGLDASSKKVIADYLNIENLFALFQASEMNAQLKICPLML